MYCIVLYWLGDPMCGMRYAKGGLFQRIFVRVVAFWSYIVTPEVNQSSRTLQTIWNVGHAIYSTAFPGGNTVYCRTEKKVAILYVKLPVLRFLRQSSTAVLSFYCSYSFCTCANVGRWALFCSYT